MLSVKPATYWQMQKVYKTIKQKVAEIEIAMPKKSYRVRNNFLKHTDLDRQNYK